MGAGISKLRITHGVRTGFWDTSSPDGPFVAKGYYTGPDLGELIPGCILQQELVEGTLCFRVGVLFRPDLNRRQRLETILVLQNWIPEMFEYEDWSEEIAV